MEQITIPKPFDAHMHLRQGQMLANVAKFTKPFWGGVIMGNTNPPITTTGDAFNYQQEIFLAAPGFQPFMTIMLNRQITVGIIRDAWEAGIKIIKFIPGNTSTNSANGVNLWDASFYFPLLREAQELGMILSIHAEAVTDSLDKLIPYEQREEEAIEVLSVIAMSFPMLRIVVEHASTYEMINYVEENYAFRPTVATITAHHLLLETSDVLRRDGSVEKPLNFCLPVAKSRKDREALIKAATSGLPCFFFGSDSAPHLWPAKNNGAAGVFSHPTALQTLAEIFAKKNALEKLPDFTSGFAEKFYNLDPPSNRGEITLKKESWQVPLEHKGIPIFRGGEKITWKIL